MTKKRKPITQSVTLHNFFSASASGGSSTTKKPKLCAESTRTPKQRIPFDVAPEDIIVIDDDEPFKHAIDVHDSSDIELLHEQPADYGMTQVTEAGKSDHPGNVSMPSESKMRSIGVFDPPSQDQNLSFGRPVLLLGTRLPERDPLYESSSKERKHALLDALPKCYVPSVDKTDLDAVPGLPVSNEDPADALKFEHFDVQPACPSPVLLRSDCQNTTSNDGGSVAQQQDIALADDEWGAGDDEIDTGVMDIQEYEEENTDTPNFQAACPICGKLLEAIASLDIERHVNRCIDTVSTLSPSSSDRPRVTSRPLSPIQPPPVQSPSQFVIEDEDEEKQKDVGAFSMLMSSYKENEAWKEASAVEDRNFRPTKANGGRRKAPFYKVLQGMPIAVDAFRYGSIPGVTAYFLTHAHSDHYTNLSANWKSGPIYCSQGTANLIMHMLGVDSKWVHPLPMDIPTEIPGTGAVRVTLIEANHCPGSCLFLFEGKQTINAGDSAYKSAFVGSGKIFRYLHCGDFRASPQHVLHPAIRGKKIDHVYLDTTYLDPKYCFPPQSQVITACAELARRIVAGETLENGSEDGQKNGKVDNWFKVQERSRAKEQNAPKTGQTLVVVGTYSIGKERIVKAIAKALRTKVYSDPRKTAILRCQADTELDELLTPDPLQAGVHLLPLGAISSDRLKIYLERWDRHFARIVGFRPTGWTYTQPSGSDSLPSISTVISRSQSRAFTYANLNPMKNSTSTLLLYGVPYSEHSSFFELTCFALSFDWGRMIATVNVGRESSRGKMTKWVEKWEAERKKRGETQVVQYRAPDYW